VQAREVVISFLLPRLVREWTGDALALGDEGLTDLGEALLVWVGVNGADSLLGSTRAGVLRYDKDGVSLTSAGGRDGLSHARRRFGL
jgi:hypothetical protein